MITKIMHRFRLYHGGLAIFVLLAYITGGSDRLHAWLGYAVGTIILIRLSWAATGVTQLGLIRFYPMFVGLKLGNVSTHPAISRSLLLAIALSLLIATSTGVALDQMHDSRSVTPTTHTSAGDPGEGDHEREHEGGWLGELHEGSANLLLVFIALHVTYLLLFKRPLAKFMLFLPAAISAQPTSAAERPDQTIQ